MIDGTAPAQRGPGFRAFLFSDLRGYTAFIETNGDEAGARLLDRYRGLVRRVIAEHDGAEVRTEGDSFYVLFPSATGAVAAGLAIVAGADQLTTDDPTVPVRVGVGIHAGEAAETAEGPVGSAINVAARICAIAKPGEVLVSETVRGLVRTSSTIAFSSRGRPALKGVGEPIELFSAVDRGAAPRPGPRRPRGLSPTSARFAGVLVVLAVIGFGAGILVSNGLSDRSGRSSAPPATPSVGSVPPSGAAPASVAGEPSVGASDGSTGADDDLIALLPPAIAKTCAPATVAQGALGGSARVRCELTSEDADTVWYDRFQALGLATEQVDRLVSAAGIEAGQCSESVTSAVGEWRFGSAYGGRLLCYQADGASWIVWTYENERIVAQATRGDGDAAALFRWWKTIGPYLR